MSTMTDRARPSPYPLFGGLAFGACIGIVAGVVAGHWEYGFHAGFFSAFAFGFAIHQFTKTAESTTLFEMDGRAAGFEADEPIVFQAVANHFKGFEAVGGKLHLTRRRLRFRSHAVNVQTHDESYPLDDITHVEPARSLGIVPNAILVHLRDGRRERFVVMGRARWVDAIRQASGKSLA